MESPGAQFAQPVMGPEGETWMGPVQEQMVPLNCPPGKMLPFLRVEIMMGECLGLEYLTMIDQLIIKQKKEMLEAITAVMGAGFETSNKYKIKNVLGQVCYITYLFDQCLPLVNLEHLQSQGGH